MEPETLNILSAVFFWWLEVKGCPKRTDSFLIPLEFLQDN